MKRSRLFYVVISLAVLMGLMPHIVLAAAPGQASSGGGAIGFLFAGTLVVWVGFFAYAFYIARKNRDLQHELEDLRRSTGSHGS